MSYKNEHSPKILTPLLYRAQLINKIIFLGCPTKFAKRGCYKMPPPHQKTKEQLLFNRRNIIEWTDKWDQFIEKLVCEYVNIYYIVNDIEYCFKDDQT